MANNYPLLSQPSAGLSEPFVASNSTPSPAHKSNKTLMVILIVVLFIILAVVSIILLIIFTINAPIAKPSLSLIQEYQDSSGLYSISPSGKYLAYAASSVSVKVLDIESNTQVAEFTKLGEYPNDLVTGIAFMEDDQLLSITTRQAFIYFADIKTKLITYKVDISYYILQYKVTKDFKSAIIKGKSVILEYSFADREIVDRTFLVNQQLRIISIDLSPDKKYISFVVSNGSVNVLDFDTFYEIFAVRGYVFEFSIFTPDSRYLVLGNLKGDLEIRDMNGFAQVSFLRTGDEIWDFKISQDSKYLAVGTDNGVKIYEISTGKLARFYLQGNIIRSVSFSSDGRNLFVCGDNNLIELLDLTTESSYPLLKMNSTFISQELINNSKYLIGVDEYKHIYLLEVFNLI